MASLNRLFLMGNLTRDPEYKQISQEQAVCSFGLAINRQFKNRHTDNLVQEVCYVDIDVWGPQAASCSKYLKKGRAVFVEGRLKFESWEEEGGQKRSKHRVVADRVLFIGANADTQEGAAAEGRNDFSSWQDLQGARGAVKSNEMPEPQNDAERELFDQIGQVKARVQKKKAAEQKGATGEIDYKDQPPFEDDLPF